MDQNYSSQRIETVRSFNRFYTKLIGALNTGFLSSPFSLSEVRVLYELAHRKTTTAAELSRELDIDPGQLSRMLNRLQKDGLVQKQPSAVDGRQSDLALTEAGLTAFLILDKQQSHEVAEMLAKLLPMQQERLVSAMEVIQSSFTPVAGQPAAFTLRQPRPGDLGWVVQQHGALYAQEYGWDVQFEGLVAETVSDFIKNYDPERERCWIAEMDGENVGAIFLVKHTDDTAKLRMFIVHPKARGLGIGKQLVQECLHFAKQAGYGRVSLWTMNVLSAARHIYQRAG
ncbi:MAG: GNAT family N-acetyltransferase, partial [Bacillota bacterium]